jgi:UDP-N-acetylglucosamine:LPS N-acetylglucosamine transferase
MEQEKMKSSLPTAILSYSNSVSSLMTACDLLVTKAGGLTTFEAIARRLPMALDLMTEPMPQEIGTVNMLIEAKLAKPLRQPDDIISIVETLKPKDDRQIQALPKVHDLDQVNAIYEIAQIILAFSDPVLSPVKLV